MSAESPADRRWKFPVLPFIIGEPPEPADPRLVDLLSGFYVPDISDAVGRMYTVHNIRSIFEPAIPLVGPATTAKCPPGDNLAVKKALRLTRPGDVLVVDAQGFSDWCLGGFQMLQLFCQLYVAGQHLAKPDKSADEGRRTPERRSVFDTALRLRLFGI